MELSDLMKVFPKRTLFCQNFIKWISILSYKKTANKESFIFACEIMSLEGETIISSAYRNHSFVFVDLFFHIALQKLPKDIDKVSIEELQNFSETLANFFFTDESTLKDLPQKIVDIGKIGTSIDKEPISYGLLLKRLKNNLPFLSSLGKANFTRIIQSSDPFPLPNLKDQKPELMTPTLLFLMALNSNKILNRLKVEKLFSSGASGFSFHKLVYEVKGYCAPLIFVVRNSYTTIDK